MHAWVWSLGALLMPILLETLLCKHNSTDLLEVAPGVSCGCFGGLIDVRFLSVKSESLCVKVHPKSRSDTCN